MEEHYIEPSLAGRARALVPILVCFALAVALFWLDGGSVRDMYQSGGGSAAVDAHNTYLREVMGLKLEAAWITFTLCCLFAAHIARLARKIQTSGQWPTPNDPVLFRTKVQTNPRYIQTAVALGYVAAFLWLLLSFTGFYSWYVLYQILEL